MQRRTKLALVIIAGLILLAIGLYFLLNPYLTSQQAEPTPELPTSNQPYSLGGSPQNAQLAPSLVSSTPVAPTPAATDQLALENRARNVVERVGTGSSGNGFLGYADVLLDMTTGGRSATLAAQQRMQQIYPANASAFGVSTHVASSSLTKGQVGEESLVITVQAIQSTDAGDPSKPLSSSGKQILVTFVKQADGSYLIDALDWSDVSL